jgi:hypothetical protein
VKRDDAVVLNDIEGTEALDSYKGIDAIDGTNSPPLASSDSNPVSMPLVSIQIQKSMSQSVLVCDGNG